MSADQTLFTSESVTEGHPDKLCDQISDGMLDECLRQDPNARVACETATTTGTILVCGEITTTAWVDVPGLVRTIVRDIGYVNADYGFDYQSCGVLTAIKEQSREIAQGVNESLEARAGTLASLAKRGPLPPDPHELGAGDQGMMFGFAVRETEELMPLPITLAHAVAKELAAARKSKRLPWLRPDGKSQVTVEYSRGVPQRVHTVVVAAQHDPGIPRERIEAEIRDVVVKAAIPERWLDEKTTYLVNGTGTFTIGGPMGDAGLTGRKIIVDTYGGYARHGGGAFSGKDPTKVDRSAAYAARYVAKNVVQAGLADRFEVQVAYVIGGARPISLNVETFGTGTVSDETIRSLIAEHFDFRPGAIIERFGLRRPIYRQTAAYGHFGRPDLELPWERTDLAPTLARAAGVKAALA
jgi:S-adenosylmethionine synthetase